MLEASHYDSLLDDCEAPPVPCPICTGDEDAEPCGEDCHRIYQQCRIKRGIKALYGAAFTAVYMAKVYRKEEGRQGSRELKALEAARVYRSSIRVMRGELAKARVIPTEKREVA